MKLIIVFIALSLAITFVVAQTNSCEPTTTCNGNGLCKPDGTCLCHSKYATYPDNNPTECNYRRKYQLTAFLLHTFLGGFGAGHFYIDDVSGGVGQLALSIIIPLVLSVIVCMFACICFKNDLGKTLMGAVVVIWVVCWIGVIAWWVVDMVRFADNYYDDSNGVSLAPW